MKLFKNLLLFNLVANLFDWHFEVLIFSFFRTLVRLPQRKTWHGLFDCLNISDIRPWTKWLTCCWIPLAMSSVRQARIHYSDLLSWVLDCWTYFLLAIEQIILKLDFIGCCLLLPFFKYFLGLFCKREWNTSCWICKILLYRSFSQLSATRHCKLYLQISFFLRWNHSRSYCICCFGRLNITPWNNTVFII